jgi:hypothetical protein
VCLCIFLRVALSKIKLALACLFPLLASGDPNNQTYSVEWGETEKKLAIDI